MVPSSSFKDFLFWFMTQVLALSHWQAPAESILAELEDHNGVLVRGARSAWVSGSVDHSRALLLALLERYEEAGVRFESALEVEHRIGAAALAAQTRDWYAKMLIDRGDPSDQDRALDMLHQAKEFADGSSMHLISREAAALLDSHVAPDSPRTRSV